MFHALWSCPSLKVVRSDFLKVKGLAKFEKSSFLDFMLACRDLLSHAELERLCVVVWRVWFRRNARIHESSPVDAQDVVQWADLFLADFRRVNEAAGRSSAGSVLVGESWRPPDVGVYKINTDAAIDVAANRTGTGAIIRDHCGMVLASCA